MQPSLLMLLNVLFIIGQVDPTILAPLLPCHPKLLQNPIQASLHQILASFIYKPYSCFYQHDCSSTKYNYKMSTERQERSASFAIKQRAVKVNHNSKLLPLDFFPKINSQSPKKKHQFAPQKAGSLLVEWYEREEESKEKPQRVYRRLVNPRPTTSRVSLCAAEQPSQIQKQRYVLDYYNRVKENLKANESPVKLPSNIPRPIFGEQRRFIRRKASISSKEKQQNVIRLARSESRPRRGKTPESITKNQPLPPQHKSQRQLSHKFDEQEVSFTFDGMVTFSKFK